jgi:hypothetical protein
MNVSPDQLSDQENELRKRSENVFSSEKREDLWAILLTLVILGLSFAMPESINHFFTKTLYLF